MGGDHTAGNAFGARDKVDPLGKENQVELSKGLQVDCAIVDLLGICLFARTPVAADMGLVADLINNLLGLELNKESIYDLARETLRLEEEFNRKAGLTERRLPEFFYKEKLPPHNTVFDVPQEEIDNLQLG
jgi:aldehyde:ferredoxin oxidoreductase